MKKVIALIAICCSAAALLAEPLTPGQALARVQSHSGARKIIGQRNVKPELIAELPELYVFSAGQGYMILPANDIAQPLLAYADEGEFNLDNNPSLQWWLSTYSAEIAAAAETSDINVQDFEDYAREPISPLLTTKWDQDAPYNDEAPLLNGERCVTGCVATAMAQVMKYHNWPETGQGSITYRWSTGKKNLSMNFSQVSFDWENMENTYNSASTAAQTAAVATLMKACGYSVKMDYSPISSGAISDVIGGALIEYFNYDCGISQPRRDCFTAREWEDIIYTELTNRRPVLYSGRSATGGHQFVCDGYSTEGFFHFNWGWSGLSDGYFKLNALNPGSQGIGGQAGGYNMDQVVLTGVQPPQADSKPVYSLSLQGNYIPENITNPLGTEFTIASFIYNSGCVTIPEGTKIAIELTSGEDADPIYIPCFTTAALEVGYGYTDFPANPESSYPKGRYDSRLVFQVPGGEWQPVQVPIAAFSELIITITDTDLIFSATELPGIEMTGLPQSKKIYLDSLFEVAMTVRNQSSQEFIGTVRPVVIPTNSAQIIAIGTSVPVELSGNETSEFTYIGYIDADISPGNYRLVFQCVENGDISDFMDITIAERPETTSIEVSDFKFEGMQPDNKARFSMTITCTEGYLDSGFSLGVWHANTGEYATHTDVDIILYKGESRKVVCDVDLSGLEHEEYVAAVFYYDILEPIVLFNYITDTDSLTQPEIRPADTAIYDLQGRRISNPAPGQLYIRGGKLIRL